MEAVVLMTTFIIGKGEKKTKLESVKGKRCTGPNLGGSPSM